MKQLSKLWWVLSFNTVLLLPWRDDCVNSPHYMLPTENCWVNQILPLPHVLAVPSLEWMAALFQLSGPIRSRPHKQTYGGEMEMRCPSSGLTEDGAVRHFPNSKSWVRASSYLALAFCLRTGGAAGADLKAGSGAGVGLTVWYRLRPLRKNTSQVGFVV